MSLLEWPSLGLAWLGRHGTRATASAIFVGLFVPGIGALCRPLVPYAIFALLVLAFLRVDPTRLRGYLVRPGIAAGATLWIMVAVPALVGFLLHALGLGERFPALLTALMLQASAAPIMSAPAFAALIGLDAALSLATLLMSMVVTPVTVPFFVALFIGPDLVVSPVAIGLKLLLLLAGSALVAAAIRRLLGRGWVEAQRGRIDGLSVVLLFVFAAAVMDGVLALLMADPLFVLGLTALAFAISLGLTVVTTVLFLWAGVARGFTLGLCSGLRNMGLMLAAAAGALPETSWLYSGLVQFPIYLAPQLLLPVATWLVRREEEGNVAPPPPS